MRTLLLLATLIALAAAPLIAADAQPADADEDALPASLDAMLDERITLNEAYRDTYAEEAKEAQNAVMLEKLERSSGQAWVDLLRHVRASDDRELKIRMLRMELLGEQVSSAWDMEFAEDLMERATAATAYAGWTAALEHLETLVR